MRFVCCCRHLDTFADAWLLLQMHICRCKKILAKKISEKMFPDKKIFLKKIVRKFFFRKIISRKKFCYWEVYINESCLLFGGSR